MHTAQLPRVLTPPCRYDPPFSHPLSIPFLVQFACHPTPCDFSRCVYVCVCARACVCVCVLSCLPCPCHVICVVCVYVGCACTVPDCRCPDPAQILARPFHRFCSLRSFPAFTAIFDAQSSADCLYHMCGFEAAHPCLFSKRHAVPPARWLAAACPAPRPGVPHHLACTILPSPHNVIESSNLLNVKQNQPHLAQEREVSGLLRAVCGHVAWLSRILAPPQSFS